MRNTFRWIDDILTGGVALAQLTCIEGPDFGRVALLKGHAFTLGRDKACDLPLIAPEISRQHARITLMGGRAFLHDLDSANGASAQGCRIPAGMCAPLVLGSQFRLGSDVFVLTQLGADTAQMTVEPDAIQLLTYDLSTFDQNTRLHDGDHAVVYRYVRGGQSRGMAGSVIVKVLNDSTWQQPQRRAELAQRVRYLMQIKHDHLVPVLGADTQVRQPSIVEEAVVARSLHEVLAEKIKLTEVEAVRILKELCLAFDHLHAVGVSQGAFNNRSILLDRQDRARLIYFDAMSVPGTPVRAALRSNPYRAPELAHQPLPTPASDIYSLGALAYHWVTGQNPVVEQFSQKRRSSAWLGPRQAGAAISAKFEQVILRAIQTDPLRRFASAHELAQAVERCR